MNKKNVPLLKDQSNREATLSKRNKRGWELEICKPENYK